MALLLFTAPMERIKMACDMDNFLDFNRPLHLVAPYWIDQPAFQDCSTGNVVNKIINDDKEFELELDITQFRPDELSVNIRDNELVVEGHHKERNHKSGRIERHFIRKYIMPDDVNQESIESRITDRGVLSIVAKKLAVNAPKYRTIPIQVAPIEKKSTVEQEETKES